MPRYEPPVYTLPPDLRDDNEMYAMAPTNLWHLPRTLWDRVWGRVGGEGIKIAILDTGCNDHPDLPEVKEAQSFISGQSWRDGNGHGTHCAGTALGRNGIGVAPRAELMVGKVLSNGGSGSSSGIAAGIRWAADKGADVISMSLGGGSSYGPTNQAIDYAFSRGCLVNAAAGNSGFNGRTNTVGWPAKYTGCLCNGATQQSGAIAGFSSGGAELDWATPGQQIVSASHRGGYATMSGTSMATPYGSGVLALIIELMRREGRARWTAVEAVRAFFKQYCEDRGAPGHDPSFGHGVPRVEDIVVALAEDNIKWL